MSVTEKSELLERIDAALESVRPHLKVDGGNVEVVGVTEDMMAQIKWMGNCESCNMSTMTLRAGIEEAIRSKIPEIKGVVAMNGVA